jgi:kynurenine formamidase
VRTPHGGPARRPILHYPTLSPQAAERLTRLRVKAIIVDVLSIDVAD